MSLNCDLQVNKTLKALDLSENGIRTSGVDAIGNALQVCVVTYTSTSQVLPVVRFFVDSGLSSKSSLSEACLCSFLMVLASPNLFCFGLCFITGGHIP